MKFSEKFLRTLRSSLAFPALLLCLLEALGCGRSDSRVVYDFAHELRSAEVTLEAAQIDLGRSGARDRLIDGWSWDERADDGTDFVWGLGASSSLVFDLLEVRPVAVRVRCAPRDLSVPADPSVTVAVNGVEVSELELVPGWREYDFVLPSAHLAPGPNRLEFRYAAWSPPEPRPGDTRPVTVGWDWIRLAGHDGMDPTTSDRLELTSGTRIDYFLDIAPRSRLRLEDLSIPAGSGLGLTLTITSDRGSERHLLTVDRSGGSVEIGLSDPGLARLRWTVRSERPTPRPPRLSIGRAVVETASGPAPELQPRQAAPTEPRGAHVPNVVIYLVDTLRADRLGAYGNQRSLTPEFDEFAASGIVFEKMSAQASWTLPAVASILTGVWPPTHGVAMRDSRLPTELPTLPELLSGHQSAVWSTNGWISAERGFDRGVSDFQRLGGAGCRSDGRAILNAAEAWFARPDVGKPFFHYIHTREPHTPYDAPERFRERFAPSVADLSIGTPDFLVAMKTGRETIQTTDLGGQIALYEAEVACSDAVFREYLRLLESAGVYDDTLILLIADHGEEFGEHGSLLHGHSLYQELIDVPLIVKLPESEWSGRRVAQRVQQIDVLPTVLEAVGLPTPPTVEGRSVLPLVEAQTSGDLPAFSALRDTLVSVIYRGMKAIVQVDPLRSDLAQVYSLGEDPRELDDLSHSRPVMAGFLVSLIRARLRESRGRFDFESIELEAPIEAELKALGYLN